MAVHVLFVEDQPKYFGPLIKSLRERYTLRIERTLSAAITALCETRFGLVVVDIMIPLGPATLSELVDPRRSGLYLIRVLRGENSLPGVSFATAKDVPVVAFTAVSDLSLQSELQQRNIATVKKPFVIRELLDRMAQMLERESDGR